MQGIREIVSRLEQAEIPYCLVGGMAAIAYGRPRLTLDADLVIALLPSSSLSDLAKLPFRSWPNSCYAV
jgi:hypothetical protein